MWCLLSSLTKARALQPESRLDSRPFNYETFQVSCVVCPTRAVLKPSAVQQDGGRSLFLLFPRGMPWNRPSSARLRRWRSSWPPQPMRGCPGTTATSAGRKRNGGSTRGHSLTGNSCEYPNPWKIWDLWIFCHFPPPLPCCYWFHRAEEV